MPHVLLVTGDDFGHEGYFMTDFQCDDDLAHTERTVVRAWKALETAVAVLESAVDAAKAPGAVDASEMVKDVKAVNAAFLWAMQQEGKARDAGSQRFGRGGGGQPLDLEAARAEVEFRLACLRGAGGDGAVPCEPE
jgi:hypothetical protein